MSKFKARLQTPQEIEAEIEQQKIRALEEKVTIAVNKMLNQHKNLQKYVNKKEVENDNS